MAAEVDSHYRRRSPPYRGYERRRSRSRSRERHGRENDRSKYGRNGQAADWREKEKRQKELEYYAARRREREKVAKRGVPEVWALSPARPEFDSDDEEVVKRREEAELLAQLARSSSGEDGGRKRRKHKKKKSKKNRYKEKHGKKKRKVVSESDSSEKDSEEEEEEEEEEEAVWVEKRVQQEGEDIYVGPVPEIKVQAVTTRKDYGHALLPGEGEAMAAYVESGKRIPRRGEIGLTSNEIATFEDAGYVMSGSRHRRMEAVRIRKENQIYSADDRRALANFNREERLKKENEIMSVLRTMIHKKKGEK